MLIPRSALAARKCCDRNSTRYALGAVAISRNAGQPTAVATDGHRLVALTWQEPVPHQPGPIAGLNIDPQANCETFLLPYAAADQLEKCKIGSKARRPEMRHIAYEECTDPLANTAKFAATDGDQIAAFTPKAQEGLFPRWQEVIPRATSRDVTVCLKTSLLRELLEVFESHLGTDGDAGSVVISLDPDSPHARPITITGNSPDGRRAVGVIMPYGTGKRPANRWQEEFDSSDLTPAKPIATETESADDTATEPTAAIDTETEPVAEDQPLSAFDPWEAASY